MLKLNPRGRITTLHLQAVVHIKWGGNNKASCSTEASVWRVSLVSCYWSFTSHRVTSGGFQISENSSISVVKYRFFFHSQFIKSFKLTELKHFDINASCICSSSLGSASLLHSFFFSLLTTTTTWSGLCHINMKATEIICITAKIHPFIHFREWHSCSFRTSVHL